MDIFKYIIYMHKILKVCNVKIYLFGETSPVFISDIFLLQNSWEKQLILYDFWKSGKAHCSQQGLFWEVIG